jgi:hypothetical protein
MVLSVLMHALLGVFLLAACGRIDKRSENVDPGFSNQFTVPLESEQREAH